MENCPKVIDFSSWQGRVDYKKLKAEGVEAVYVRWGVGHINADAAYAYNYLHASDEGVDFGAYQVLDFRRDPVWQADMFLAGHYDDDLLPVLDAERYQTTSPRNNAIAAKFWLDTVEVHLSVKPLIYTRKYWWEANMGRWADWSAEYPLWVANYTRRAKPLLPRQWSDYALWQYSAKGQIDGVPGTFDFNRFGSDPRAIYR